MAGTNLFEGNSSQGILQDALAEAVRKAEQSSSAIDELVTWTLDAVKGETGGIAGLNLVTVTVVAHLSSESSK